MPEEERLELVSAVEDEFSEPLERMEKALDDVDESIADAGRGRDHIEIDVETDGVASATGELEALDAAIENLDDGVTIDVDTDFDDVLAEDVVTDDRLRGSQFRSTETGQPVSSEDALDRRFSDVSEAIEDEMDGATVEIDTATADIDADTATVDTGGDLSSVPESDPQVVTSGGRDLGRSDPDMFTPSGVEVGGFDSPNAVGGERMAELMDFHLGGTDDNRGGSFRRFKQAIGAVTPEFGNLETRLQSLRFTMGALHQTIAALIPIAGVFAGALPAAVTGVAALGTAALGAAGALAGIGVLGAVGLSLQATGGLSMEPIQDRLAGVADAFLDAFGPLARSLAPLIEQTITQIELMAGPLATASAGLLQFRDAFTDAVAFLTGAVPSLTADILAFSQAALPLVQRIVGVLSSVDVFGFLATELSDALVPLTMIGRTVMELVPALVHLSNGFLTVAAGLALVIRPVLQLINTFPVLGKVIGVVTGLFLTLVTASTLYLVATTRATLAAATFAKTLVTSVAAALKIAILELHAYSVATFGAYTGTLLLVSAITLGIGAVAIFASSFSLLGDNIRNAKQELRQFARTGSALTGTRMSLASDRMSTGRQGRNGFYQDNSTTVIQAGDRDAAARQQYSSQYEREMYVDSVFGGG